MGMTNIILLLICLIIGILMQRLKAMPQNAHVALNQVILYVALPAIALLNVPNIHWNLSLFSLILAPWLWFFVVWGLMTYLGAKFHWRKTLVGCLILCAGCGNTSFVGYPIIEALFGKDALSYAILFDQPGTFLISSSFGVYIAAAYSSGNVPLPSLLKKVVTFPFFIAFFISLILGMLGWHAEGDIKIILEKLAVLMTPLALISVGLQLKMGDFKTEKKYLSLGLGLKLIICPLMIFILYQFLNLPPEIFKVAVMEGAMAPMITASILASTYGLEPKLAGMMVGLGVPVSLITLSLWYLVL